MSSKPSQTAPGVSKRMHRIDTLRGCCVVSMIGFHTWYDLVYLFGYTQLMLPGTVIALWRASIAWVFLWLAGMMCGISRSNLRRGLTYGGVAVLIWLLTSLLSSYVEPISFGIMYCMAACVGLWWIGERLGLKPAGWLWSLCALLVFALSFWVPTQTYPLEGLAWLGMPGPHFSSGDYYPLVPFFFMFASGATMGTYWAQTHFPAWFMTGRPHVISWIGCHALVIYCIHQVAILAVLYMLQLLHVLP